MSETQERIVTIFGGARCTEADPEYAQAHRVGELLAEAGFVICTGGYLGIMEAASRGAREKGGRVLGIVWNKLQTRVIEPRPLVLLGDCWPPIVETWRQYLAVSERDVSVLDFAQTPEQAVSIINEKA